MELNPKYLSYDDYKSLGGTIPETTFKTLEYQAEIKINMYTFNRLSKLEYSDIPNEVKMCAFSLIPLMSGNENSNILSESIGNYSVTKKSSIDLNKETENIIKEHLSNVKVNKIPVLYIGADEN